MIDMSAHAGMILDVKFLDANTGFVFAGTSGDVQQLGALILKTRDGGKSWNPSIARAASSRIAGRRASSMPAPAMRRSRATIPRIGFADARDRLGRHCCWRI